MQWAYAREVNKKRLDCFNSIFCYVLILYEVYNIPLCC